MVARGRGSLAASQQMIRSGTYKTDSRKTKCYGKGSCNTSKRNSVDRRTLHVNTSCGMADTAEGRQRDARRTRAASSTPSWPMRSAQAENGRHTARVLRRQKATRNNRPRRRRGSSMAKALAGQAGRCMAAALAAACSPAVPLASQAGNGGPQSPLLRIGGHAPRTQALLKNGRWVRCVGFAFAFMLFSTVLSTPLQCPSPACPRVLAYSQLVTASPALPPLPYIPARHTALAHRVLLKRVGGLRPRLHRGLGGLRGGGALPVPGPRGGGDEAVEDAEGVRQDGVELRHHLSEGGPRTGLVLHAPLAQHLARGAEQSGAGRMVAAPWLPPRQGMCGEGRRRLAAPWCTA